jgi:putative membrane fusion protein
VVLLIVGGAQTAHAKKGELTYTGDFASVIIRDETVYEAENYDKAVFIAAEGAKVKKGTAIAQVYEWGYNDNILNSLLDLQNKIKQYQENTILKDVVNVDLTKYNEDIQKKTDEIHEVIAGGKEGDIITLERELKELMTKRKNYLKEAAKADDELTELYTDEEARLNRIKEWQVDIKAKTDGYLSFYFDGCEQFMNVKNLDKLNKKNIDSILKGDTTNLVEDDHASRPLYRLVTANKWYVLIYCDKKVVEFNKNQKFSFSFQDIYDKKYNGKLLSEREDARGYIYTFLMSDDVSSLLRVRRINVTIDNTFSGIKVPEGAIKNDNGVTGVYVVQENKSVFVPVTVLIKKGGESIVAPVNKNSPLTEDCTVET